MGGAATKNWNTHRLQKRQYDDVVADVIPKLRGALPTCFIEPVLSYASKHDFGDLDIVVSGISMEDMIKTIDEVFNPVGSVRNGNVYSWVYEQDRIRFQVDVIVCEPEWVQFALNYFNYNDVGNMIGVVAKNVGLKLAFDGLKYRYHYPRDNPVFVTDITITHNWQEAMDLLDYGHYDYVKQTFNAPNDLYNFITSSAYFGSVMFQWSSLNNQNRTRNAKRPIYVGFVKHLNDHPELAPHPRVTSTPWMTRTLTDTIARLDEDNQRLLDFHQLFNGTVVSRVLNLPPGPELGSFMAWLRINNKNLVETILQMTPDDINTLITDNYHQYKDTP